jgi:uncharacterized UPF0146 family protein
MTLSKALNSCAFQYLFQDFQNMKIYMPHVENDDVISLEVSLLEGGNILYSIRIGLSAKIFLQNMRMYVSQVRIIHWVTIVK